MEPIRDAAVLRAALQIVNEDHQLARQVGFRAMRMDESIDEYEDALAKWIEYHVSIAQVGHG